MREAVKSLQVARGRARCKRDRVIPASSPLADQLDQRPLGLDPAQTEIKS